MGPVPVLPPWFGGQAVDAWPRGGDVMLNCQYPQQRYGKGVGRVPWGSVGRWSSDHTAGWTVQQLSAFL